VMSSYARYCREQAGDCARRARLASSPQVAASYRTLENRWLNLVEKAELALVRKPLSNTLSAGIFAAHPTSSGRPGLSLHSPDQVSNGALQFLLGCLFASVIATSSYAPLIGHG
jgi:hypothetical protein